MRNNKLAWLIVLALTVLIKIFSFFPAAVERYYSRGIYLLVSGTLRILFGWIPFSIGDIFYFVVAIYGLIKLWRLIAGIFRKRQPAAWWLRGLRRTVFFVLVVYCVFNILWGLNYNRLGMAEQLGLQMKPYTTAEIRAVTEVLVQRLASNVDTSMFTRARYARGAVLFNQSDSAYLAVANGYPQLQYKNRSIKSSLYGYLGDYLGYSGYYNPFSGEAQVNTTVPVFMLPFTACHEMGHQLGYAKENEANFAGYLSAKSSGDAAFRYSVYFDLYNYGIRELYYRDSTTAIELNKRKPLQVKIDNQALRKFYTQYENPIEPYIRKLYGQYLKANQQPSGMESYSEVMAFLVAYYNKYGAAAL